MTQETITAAAVRYEGMTFALPPPARHGECLCLANTCRPDSFGKQEQGFVTSRHRFVDRLEAKRIAIEAGQLIARAGKLPELFSEDVW